MKRLTFSSVVFYIVVLRNMSRSGWRSCSSFWPLEFYNDLWQIDCFVCFNGVLRPSQDYFTHIETSPLYRRRCRNLYLCYALMALCSEGSLSCHAYRDTGPRFLRSHPNDLEWAGGKITSQESDLGGIEPTTLGSESQRLNHWAKSAHSNQKWRKIYGRHKQYKQIPYIVQNISEVSKIVF